MIKDMFDSLNALKAFFIGIIFSKLLDQKSRYCLFRQNTASPQKVDTLTHGP